MSVCTQAGLNDGALDPASGVPFYCLDNEGNVAQNIPGLAGAVSGAVSTTTGGTNWANVFGQLETDFLSAWRTIQAPPVAPGSIGVTGSVGASGVTVQGSPVLLIGLIVIVYLLVKKDL